MELDKYNSLVDLIRKFNPSVILVDDKMFRMIHSVVDPGNIVFGKLFIDRVEVRNVDYVVPSGKLDLTGPEPIFTKETA
jgi:hypothetical protein